MEEPKKKGRKYDVNGKHDFIRFRVNTTELQTILEFCEKYNVNKSIICRNAILDYIADVELGIKNLP